MSTPIEQRAVLIQANGEFVVRPATVLASHADFLRIFNRTPFMAYVLIPPNGMLGELGDIRPIASGESFQWTLGGGPGAYPYAIEVEQDAVRGFAQRSFARGESAPHVIIQ